jgi:hypothetical protein
MSKCLVMMLLCVPTFAQVKHVAVQSVRQTEKEVTYQVVNESSQPVTSYTVGVDLTYGDGAVIRAEVSGEFGPSGHPIARGAAFEQVYPLGGSMHGKVLKVDLVPLVAIYSDGTAEAQDSAVFHRIADHRVMVEKAKMILVDAARQALGDETERHPSATALALVRAAIDRSDAETAGPAHKIIVVGKTPIQPDESLLKDAATYLEGLKQSPNEREELTSYLASEQRELEECRSSAGVRLGGVR